MQRDRLSHFPLTDFLIALDKHPETLTRADPEQIAARYGINPDHVRGYLRTARGG